MLTKGSGTFSLLESEKIGEGSVQHLVSERPDLILGLLVIVDKGVESEEAVEEQGDGEES